MWTRKELKDRAKVRLKATYWKVVLVALIAAIIGSGSSGIGAVPYTNITKSYHSTSQTGQNYSDTDEYDEDWSEDDSWEDTEDYDNDGFITRQSLGLGIVFVLIFGIVLAIVLAISIFLLNPLSIGCCRYFTQDLYTDAIIDEVGFTFSKNYKNGIYVMFFRGLYTFLWSLLFIIPGIIKSYEYRMIPYLLAENPDMDKDSAFAISRQMMNGNKWDTFVLDLSFYPWFLLSALTCGILSIFYVNPYVFLTQAALYDSLKQNNGPQHVENMNAEFANPDTVNTETITTEQPPM